MNKSILRKLEGLQERHEEIQALLSEASVINNQEQYRALTKEYSQLEDIVGCYGRYCQAEADLAAGEEMLAEDDAEMKAMAEEEIEAAKETIETLSHELQILLLPKDPNDDNNCFLELRAGAGGDEAAIFAGDLYRMYTKYAEQQRWQIEVVSVHEGEHGGFKELIAHITGTGVYGKLKFESGGHRVQRVPETESQGRVHTSACTVAIMAEIAEAEAITINPSEIRVDTFRASGAGGQHVNKTDSAIRITHLPTGLVVECQDGRSQHKNRAQAMKVLISRLAQREEDIRHAAEQDVRRNLLSTGDRSDRIRTYNYPQGRVSDHRINLTLYRLHEVLEGNLEMLTQPILQEHQADMLAALADY
ncbi:peptide chain release factor 1 [Oceanisphaera sp. W20_SRM_FM3]|uniref:peptide chain release factor 1 n=1 Tax=Oceanisphaera sp. W20_SRM_FM3 TaxID=3240267 RepID=UPI003F9DF990